MVSKDAIRLIVGFLLLAGICATTSSADAPSRKPYVTWSVFEPDKCATIWLIERFLTPGADFRFFAPESDPPEGILFDTPDAPFKRTHNKSTFQSIVDHYRISGAGVAYIGRLMHDIEINTWRRKALPESRLVESELNNLLLEKAPAEVVQFCLDYFDELLADQRLVPRSEDIAR